MIVWVKFRLLWPKKEKGWIYLNMYNMFPNENRIKRNWNFWRNNLGLTYTVIETCKLTLNVYKPMLVVFLNGTVLSLILIPDY